MSRPIAESVSLLSETLTNCKTNLKDKGVESDTIKISDVDEKIAEIQAGGGSSDSVTITITCEYGENDGEPECTFNLKSPDSSKTYSPTDVQSSSNYNGGDYEEWTFYPTFTIPKSDLEEPQILDLYCNGTLKLCYEVDNTGFFIQYKEYYQCYKADTNERVGYLSSLKREDSIKVGNQSEERISAAEIKWTMPTTITGYKTGESFKRDSTRYMTFYIVFQTDPILVYQNEKLVSH